MKETKIRFERKEGNSIEPFKKVRYHVCMEQTNKVSAKHF